MRFSRLRRPLGAVLLCVLAVVLVGHAAATPGAYETEKSVYVFALDKSGRAVTDLTADEFALREDGQDRQIVGVKRATQRLQVQFLVDTTQMAAGITQNIRTAASAFVRRMLEKSPDTQIALMEFGQAAIPVVPFTSDRDELEKGIHKLVANSGAASVLLEALLTSCKTLAARESPRRVIVVLNMEPAAEQSRQDPGTVQAAFGSSMAQMWAVSLQRVQGNTGRDVLLNQVARLSGGQRDFIVAISAMETYLSNYADVLSFQYEITHLRPEKTARLVQVGTVRQGLTLHANIFAPK